MFDKAHKADIVSMLRLAKSEFCSSNPLNQFSKLVKIFQSCGNDTEKLKWVVSLLYSRFRAGTIDVDLGKDKLSRVALPCSVMLYEIAVESTTHWEFAEPSGSFLRDACMLPLQLGVKLQGEGRQLLMPLSTSAAFVVSWMESAFRGDHDSTLMDMVANFKKAAIDVKFKYSKLNLCSHVDDLVLREKAHLASVEQLQRKTAKQKKAAAVVQVGDDDADTASDCESSDSAVLLHKAPQLSPGEEREFHIATAFEQHCDYHLKDNFVIILRPTIRQDLGTLFETVSMIKDRKIRWDDKNAVFSLSGWRC